MKQTKQEIRDMKVNYFMCGIFLASLLGSLGLILIDTFAPGETIFYQRGFEAGKLNVSCEVEPPYESNPNKSKIDVSTLRFNPEISQKPRDNIVSINLEVCKPISCPQPYVGIYTLQACYNCSEVRNENPKR